MTLTELSEKDVIRVPDGENLGRADDLRWDPERAAVEGILLFGRPHFFGLLGRDPDLFIPWNDVERVGSDVVMVKTQTGGWTRPKKHRKCLFALL